MFPYAISLHLVLKHIAFPPRSHSLPEFTCVLNIESNTKPASTITPQSTPQVPPPPSPRQPPPTCLGSPGVPPYHCASAFHRLSGTSSKSRPRTRVTSVRSRPPSPVRFVTWGGMTQREVGRHAVNSWSVDDTESMKASKGIHSKGVRWSSDYRYYRHNMYIVHQIVMIDLVLVSGQCPS